jgi:DNA (cytosine-5)-methyltransferase 1
VFVVGCLGDWRRAAAVLFERHSLQGHPAPSREAGKGSAVGTLGGTSPGGGWRFGADEAAAGQLIAANTGDTAACLTHHAGRYDLDTETFVATTLRARDGSKGVDSDCTDTLVPVAYRTSGNCGAWETGDRVDALTTGTDPNSHLVRCITGDVAHTLKAEGFDASEDGTGRGQPMVNHAAGVRRLTPRECERLQGFPDDWTLTPYRGKPAADGPRYKALGNSMAVPVMAWIGKRIEMVEAFTSPAAAPAQAAE